MEDQNMNYEMNYIPDIVDIEGLQGMNSSQGMEYLMHDLGNVDPMYRVEDMYSMPPVESMDNMYSMPPMQGMDNMYNMPPMQGMDNMYNMGSMQGNEYMNGMMPMGGTCAEVISCMASMCYMMSVFLTQMLQGNNGMGMYPQPMQGCDCMQNNSTSNPYGYPPMF